MDFRTYICRSGHAFPICELVFVKDEFLFVKDASNASWNVHMQHFDVVRSGVQCLLH